MCKKNETEKRFFGFVLDFWKKNRTLCVHETETGVEFRFRAEKNDFQNEKQACFSFWFRHEKRKRKTT